MAAPRTPQDHKAKEEKPKVEKLDVTIGEGDTARQAPARRVTIDGIEVTVLDEALDDWELLDDLRAVQDAQDASRMPSVMRRLLGDQYKTVIDALRPEGGRVTVETGSKFLMDLFGALNPSS